MTEPNNSQLTPGGILNEERAAREAKAAMTPHLRHGLVAKDIAEQTTGFENLHWADLVETYADKCADTGRGDLSAASNMLTSQAMTLDTLFTEMLWRAMANTGSYPQAAERYMRMAMKAQAQSRATLEALAKLHQPREQTVKHVHIDNRGGQAVVAETVQTGGSKTKNADQSHERTCSGSVDPALLGNDPTWHAMSVSSFEGQEAVPHSRGQCGGTNGQSQRLEARGTIRCD